MAPEKLDSDDETTAFLNATSPIHQHNQPSNRRNPLTPILLSALLILNSITLLLLIHQSSTSIPSSPCTPRVKSEPTNGPGNENSTKEDKIPHIAFPNTTIFVPHPAYESFSAEHNALWESLQPPNGGFLIRAINGTRQPLGISMLHQLHCLTHMRLALQSFHRLLANSTPISDFYPHRDRYGNEVPGVVQWEHVGHCLDYVRQGVECAADETLEWPDLSTGLGRISGWGTGHVCRDADRVRALSRESGWMDEEVHP